MGPIHPAGFKQDSIPAAVRAGRRPAQRFRVIRGCRSASFEVGGFRSGSLRSVRRKGELRTPGPGFVPDRI